MRGMRVAPLALGWVLGLGCAPVSPAASGPTAEISPPNPSPASPAESESAPEPEPEPAPPTAAPAEKEETPSEVAMRINTRYAENTDAKNWQRRFEREGREAHDKRAEIVARLGLAPGTAIADVGAGSGMFTLEFSDAVGSEGVVFAVDVQDYFLDHIRARAKARGRSNIRTVVASQTSVSLQPGSVDVVFFCDVYHHLERPNGYLKTVHEALRESGRLVIIDYDRTIPGADRWLKDHIRADPSVFRAEIEAAGFTLRDDHDLLEENFFFVFERN